MVSHQMTYEITIEDVDWDNHRPEDKYWYFTMISELNANMPDEFGPYNSFNEALEGINRVMKKTRTAEPSVIRKFTQPYQGSAKWR